MNEKLKQLKIFLNENPDDPFIHFAIAQEYIKSEDEEKAEKILKELAARHPDYVGTYYHLGKIYERQNDFFKAAEVYKKGMAAAERGGDQHAFAELKAAYENIKPED